jgi:hypothetical protein
VLVLLQQSSNAAKLVHKSAHASMPHHQPTQFVKQERQASVIQLVVLPICSATITCRPVLVCLSGSVEMKASLTASQHCMNPPLPTTTNTHLHHLRPGGLCVLEAQNHARFLNCHLLQGARPLEGLICNACFVGVCGAAAVQGVRH